MYSTASTSSSTLQPNQQIDTQPKPSFRISNEGHYVLQSRQDTPEPRGLELGKVQLKRHLHKLAMIHEVIQDILTRKQEFNSRPESLWILEEARRQVDEANLANGEDVIEQVQTVGPMLAFAFIKIGNPNVAISILEGLSKNWTKELEDRFRMSWKPVALLAYSLKHYSLAVRVAEMVLQQNDILEEWMRMFRFHCLLRIAEQGEKRKGIGAADHIWKDYERRGEKAPVYVMISLLSSQIKRFDSDLVASTLEAMKRFDYQIDVTTWRQLLHPSLRSARSRGIVKLLLAFSDTDPDSIALKLSNHFGRNQDVRNCIRVNRTFAVSTSSQKSVESAVRPMLEMQRPIIEMYLRMSEPVKAVHRLNLALDSGCSDNFTGLFLGFLRCLNRRKQSFIALAIGAKLLNSPLQHVFTLHPASRYQIRASSTVLTPSRKVYAALLSSVALLGDSAVIVPYTRLILLELFSHGKKINERIRQSLSRIIVRVCRNARWPHLIRLLQASLKGPGGEEVTEVGQEWEKLIEVLQREGVKERFEIQEWAQLPKREREERVTRRKNVKEVSTEWEKEKRLVQQGVTPSEEYPIRYPDGQVEPVRNEVISRDLNGELLHLDMVSSPAGYAMRLRVYAVIKRDHESAQMIYRSMVQHGIRPSMHHIAPIIEGLVLVNRVEDAQAIKDRAVVELEDKEISSHMYAALCRGYGQMNDWKAVSRIGEEMRRDNIRAHNSLKRTFRVARRMLKPDAEGNGDEEGARARRVVDEVIRQDSLWLKEDPKEKWKIKPVTAHFFDLCHSNQELEGHEHVAKAFDRGLKADHLLRDLLKKSENWLRKLLARRDFDGVSDGGSPRRRRRRLSALELCQSNRARARETEEDREAKRLQHRTERQARRDMVDLLREAIGSKVLWDEAQRGKPGGLIAEALQEESSTGEMR